jgi:hypothetical protein
VIQYCVVDGHDGVIRPIEAKSDTALVVLLLLRSHEAHFAKSIHHDF